MGELGDDGGLIEGDAVAVGVCAVIFGAGAVLRELVAEERVELLPGEGE